jgi:WD40 repeat protein
MSMRGARQEGSAVPYEGVRDGILERLQKTDVCDLEVVEQICANGYLFQLMEDLYSQYIEENKEVDESRRLISASVSLAPLASVETLAMMSVDPTFDRARLLKQYLRFLQNKNYALLRYPELTLQCASNSVFKTLSQNAEVVLRGQTAMQISNIKQLDLWMQMDTKEYKRSCAMNRAATERAANDLDAARLALKKLKQQRKEQMLQKQSGAIAARGDTLSGPRRKSKANALSMQLSQLSTVAEREIVLIKREIVAKELEIKAHEATLVELGQEKVVVTKLYNEQLAVYQKRKAQMFTVAGMIKIKPIRKPLPGSTVGAPVQYRPRCTNGWLRWANKPQVDDACILTLRGHSGPVTGCHMSSDCKYVLSCSDDTSLRLWLVQTGQMLREFKGHFEGVATCRFSGDCQTFVSGGKDSEVIFWNVDQEKKLGMLPEATGHKAAISTICWSPCRELVASGDVNGVLLISHALEFTVLHRLEGHSRCVTLCSFVDGGASLFSSSSDTTCRLWEAPGGEWSSTSSSEVQVQKQCTRTSGEAVGIGPYCGKGTFALIRHEQMRLDLCEATAAVKAKETINKLSASHSKTTLAETAKMAENCGVCINLRLAEDTAHEINHCSLSVKGLVVCVSNDATVRVYAPGKQGQTQEAAMRVLSVLSGHLAPVLFSTFSNDGRYLTTASADGTLKIWQTKQFPKMKSRVVGTKNDLCINDDVIATAYTPGGTHVVTCEVGGFMQVTETVSGRVVKQADLLQTWVLGTPRYLTLSREAAIAVQIFEEIWALHLRTNSRAVPETNMVTAPITIPSLLAASTYPIVAVADVTRRKVEIAHTKTGLLICVLEGHTDLITSVSFTCDSRMLIVTCRDGSIWVWDYTLGACAVVMSDGMGAGDGYDQVHPMSRLAYPERMIMGCAVSSCGNQLVTCSGSTDGVLKLWSLAEAGQGRLRKAVCTPVSLRGHKARVNVVAWSADERFFASGSEDGQIIIWNGSTCQPELKLDAHTEGVRHCIYTAGGSLLVSAGEGHEVCIWNTQTGDLVARDCFDFKVCSIAASTNGRSVCVGNYAGKVRLLRLELVMELKDRCCMGPLIRPFVIRRYCILCMGRCHRDFTSFFFLLLFCKERNLHGMAHYVADIVVSPLPSHRSIS